MEEYPQPPTAMRALHQERGKEVGADNQPKGNMLKMLFCKTFKDTRSEMWKAEWINMPMVTECTVG